MTIRKDAEPRPPVDDWSFIWKSSLYEHAKHLFHDSGFDGETSLTLAEMRIRVGFLLEEDALPIGAATPIRKA